MEIPKGYVCESCSHSLAHNLSGPKANILVNNHGHACWIDFDLLTIVAEKAGITSANAGGTIRWMSPELFDPKAFGLTDSRPTRESDCYSFGLVIYEVLGGRVPFDSYRSPDVIPKHLSGEHPDRPEGARGVWFTADIWATLVLCWKLRPADRPSPRDILRALERAQLPGRPSYMNTYTDDDVTYSIPGAFSLFHPRFQAHLNSLGSYFGASRFTTMASSTLPRPAQILELSSNNSCRKIALPTTAR